MHSHHVRFLQKLFQVVMKEKQQYVAHHVISFFSRVKTKQGMKQLEDHKVMDPHLLYLLVSGVAFLV